MRTIASLQTKMKQFDTSARKIIRSKNAEQSLQTSWKTIFGTPLDTKSAKSFAKYYRTMTSKTKKQRGGMAPLDYGMAPGLNPGASYGNFPVAINTDPQSIQDLDVYFQSAITKGCGIENSSPTIPEGMGSNMVGGRSRKNKQNKRKALRKSMASRKASRKGAASRKASRKGMASRKRFRKQHGGIADISNLGTSLYMRPYTAEAPPSILQNVGASMAGSPIMTYPSPTDNTWQYASRGADGIVNPSSVTHIGSNFSQIASPAPWQTQN
jgi:hypothetical protein